jgi:hypothetical protein
MRPSKLAKLSHEDKHGLAVDLQLDQCAIASRDLVGTA